MCKTGDRQSRSSCFYFLILLNIKLNLDFHKIKVYINFYERGVRQWLPCRVWMAELEDEDLTFIKKFLLASGSLKEVAALYGVSYPTVRLRLDRLIQKIQLTENAEADPYISLVKRLAVDDKLDFDTAKILITAYRKTKEET